MGGIKFLKHFVLSPNVTGAVVASSEGLSNLITDAAELSEASAIIEFGAGTGVFTEKIVQKIREDTWFFALEINPDFVEEIRDRYPGVRVYRDSAVNARKYLEEMGLKACDRVICGLPWASFEEGLQDELLDTILDVLRPGGRFLTFAYLHGLLLPAGIRFRRKLFSKFRKVTLTRTIWMNIPPAFVYNAEKEFPQSAADAGTAAPAFRPNSAGSLTRISSVIV